MFGIKTKIKLLNARLRWRRINKHNKTGLGAYDFGFDNVHVGQFTYGEINILTQSPTPTLSIGSFCSIAGNVTFVISDDHPLNYFSTYPFKVKALNDSAPEAIGRGGITIDDDVWIGFGATILDGVHLGQGSVVGAGAVVTKDVEPYTIVGGVPAKPIRKRFDDTIISRLLECDFETLNKEWITNHLDILYQPVDFSVLDMLEKP